MKNYVLNVLIVEKSTKNLLTKNLVKNLIKNFPNTYDCCSGEDITGADYRHAKRAYKKFNNKNLGDYHDLYVHMKTLEINILKYMNLIPLIFYQHLD